MGPGRKEKAWPSFLAAHSNQHTLPLCHKPDNEPVPYFITMFFSLAAGLKPDKISLVTNAIKQLRCYLEKYLI
jgi:hypothetical protein